MSFNFGAAYKNFEMEQEKLFRKYRKYGMSEEQISAIYDFDRQQFLGDVAYYRRARTLNIVYKEDNNNMDEGTYAAIANVHDVLTVTDDFIEIFGRYGWVEEIDDPHLAFKLKCLSDADLELLTDLVIENITQSECAERLGISQQSVAKRIAKIKDFLKN